MASGQRTLTDVDWSSLPVPEDDGAASHLSGCPLPDIPLPATDGTEVSLARLSRVEPSRPVVVFAYPMTGRPDVPLPAGWDEIPGARGCTPQSCAFRDLHADLLAAGSSAVFGLSVQDTAYQQEAASRLHLPFPLLSDAALRLTTALRLPVMLIEGRTLLKRMTLIVEAGIIARVFYPVFPPDRNAADVLSWLRAQRG
ncbi:peroxiredoxin [Hyphomicrobium sp. NDB2Meth4]|uniref:peroxiredoxin n=1 Tax=Hyphomicrobium sp. NDB2Meth4 TaxID=1892846 RepID=UPI0009317810|nr:peroxiredoxin [Hyphomicrobium sp. NDB2Meth4]